MTTYDDFVSNFVSGARDYDGRNPDMLKRNERFDGYADGWNAVEEGQVPMESGIPHLDTYNLEMCADEVWAQRED